MRKLRAPVNRNRSNTLFDFAGRSEPPAGANTVPQEKTAPARVPAPVAREKRDRPFIDSDGGLVIPFESDSKYHWWSGGQSVEETLKEI